VIGLLKRFFNDPVADQREPLDRPLIRAAEVSDRIAGFQSNGKEDHGTALQALRLAALYAGLHP